MSIPWRGRNVGLSSTDSSRMGGDGVDVGMDGWTMTEPPLTE